MNDIIYLVFRQMRRPALVILAAYSAAILGMVLMPGLNGEGQPQTLTIFQAFYWVSYTATTIGYGEVPVDFSEEQRIWVAISIYYTVPAWFYAIGKVVALLQDPTFQHAILESRFARRVSRQKDKFCIVCGFGEAGQRLVHLLLKEDYQCVVIEKDEQRVKEMVLDDKLQGVLAISGNAENVELLLKAGIQSPFCRAVIAITDSEDVNIKVALSARLLSSDQSRFKIICRTYTRTGSNNAKSFNTDVVINTAHIFAERLTTALRRPSIAELLARMYGTAGEIHESPPQPPAGHWLICGNNAVGATLKTLLDYEGVDCTMIDPQLENDKGQVKGIGTEAVTLREARIDRAKAIVAAHSSDTDNLSIAITAKEIHPSLFVVGKQNHSDNQKLFSAAGFDRVMAEADLIVSEVFPHIARPLMTSFIGLVRHQNEEWGKNLLASIEALAGEYNPQHYILQIDEKHSPAVMREISRGHLLRLQSLWMMPNDPESSGDAMALLLSRQQQDILLPKGATALQKGDRVLIIYHRPEVGRRIWRAAKDEKELFFVIHGKEKPASYFLNYILQKWDS